MRRLVLIIAALILVPIAEIAVLIASSQVIGLLWTLVLVLVTSALGGWLLRREGTRAWRAFQTDVTEGRPPGVSATNGILVLAGGIFMLVPGFVSDVIGLLLIAPPTRAVARRLLQNTITTRLSPQAGTAVFGPRQVRVRTGRPRAAADPTGPPATTGEPIRTDPARPTPALEGEIIDPGR